MRIRILSLLAVLLVLPVTEAIACSVCFADPESNTTKSMAIAIWFLMAIVMSVLGGVGAFSYHLWRHAKTPLEPHQQLAEEDLDKYE